MATLKDWRKVKGWRQEDLAEKIGEPRGTYQAYESGRASIPPDVQAKIKRLGYAGPWPEVGGDVTREDLEVLRQDLRGVIGWAREEIGKDSQALAAALQQIQERVEAIEAQLTAKPPAGRS